MLELLTAVDEFVVRTFYRRYYLPSHQLSRGPLSGNK